MTTIEVFGPGCQKCQATKRAVQEALNRLGIEAVLVEIRDPREMARHRVIFTPAVRINGEVKCTGRVPAVDELTTWLAA